MKRTLQTILLVAVAIGALPLNLSSQTSVGLLQQFRMANAKNGLPLDITLVGTLKDQTGGIQPIEVQIKGKDKMRFVIGSGNDRRITIYSRNEGWVAAGKNIQALQEHASVRRPTLIPVLDLLAEIDNPKLLATDQGFKSLGSQTVRHVSLSLPDPARQRSLGRRLDENLDVYFDPATMLVVRTVRLRRSEENMDYQVSSIMEFSDYRIVSNVAIPFRIINTIGSSHQSTLLITSAVINTNIQDRVFTPAGGLQ